MQSWRYYSNRKSFRYGVPFLLLILGGSFGLKEFTQLRYNCIYHYFNFKWFDIHFRYTFSKKKTIRPDELESVGVKMKESGDVTLETEYEKIKEIDIEHWDNIRGPRPWEEQAKA